MLLLLTCNGTTEYLQVPQKVRTADNLAKLSTTHTDKHFSEIHKAHV